MLTLCSYNKLVIPHHLILSLCFAGTSLPCCGVRVVTSRRHCMVNLVESVPLTPMESENIYQCRMVPQRPLTSSSRWETIEQEVIHLISYQHFSTDCCCRSLMYVILSLLIIQYIELFICSCACVFDLAEVSPLLLCGTRSHDFWFCLSVSFTLHLCLVVSLRTCLFLQVTSPW